MWLLEASVRKALEHAEKSVFTPSAEQISQFEARYGGDVSAQDNRLLTIAGENAAISIKGVITQTPSFMAMIFGGGGTTYPEINAAIAAMLEGGMNPDDVAGKVIDAMLDNQFWILSHPEHLEEINHRNQQLANLENPTLISTFGE